MGLIIGAYRISAGEVLYALAGLAEGAQQVVVWNIRLPRIAASLSMGRGLAMSGLFIQTMLRNPIGSPTTLGIGYRGVRGIESTERHYLPMLWSSVNNAAEKLQSKLGSHLFMDKEMLLVLDPDTVFLDGGGLRLAQQDYQKHTAFYRALGAFRERRVFVLFPFNAYATNIETALVNAYAVGKILYPDRFADVDLEIKAGDIYRFFTGADSYREMAKVYQPLGSIAPFWQENRLGAGE